MTSENFQAVLDLLTPKEREEFREKFRQEIEQDLREALLKENKALRTSLLNLAKHLKAVLDHYRISFEGLPKGAGQEFQLPENNSRENSSPLTAVVRTPEGATELSPAFVAKLLRGKRPLAPAALAKAKEVAQEGQRSSFRSTRSERIALQAGALAAIRTAGPQGITIGGIVRYLDKECSFPVGNERWGEPVGVRQLPRITQIVANHLQSLRRTGQIRCDEFYHYHYRRQSRKPATC